MRVTHPPIIDCNTPYKGYVFEKESDNRVALVKYSKLHSEYLTPQHVETFDRDEIDTENLPKFYAYVRKTYTNGKTFAIREDSTWFFEKNE